MKPKEYLPPEEIQRLSRDYVIEHEKLTIFSLEYVTEHGTDFGDGELWWDHVYGYYICDREGVYFTGLLYETYDNLRLKYYKFYENGEEHGLVVKFYPSGEVESYGVNIDKYLEGNYYEWYENGMIKRFIKQDKINHCYAHIECDENGTIIQQGTSQA